MTRVTVNGITVRVWRDEDSLDPAPAMNIRAALLAAPMNATAADLVAIAERLPRVVAVEALGEDGCGVLLYPDWK